MIEPRTETGWTNRGSEAPIPRQDVPPDRFYHETKPGNPASAAWDEPGYEDPDAKHAGLPLGARYWQGFAKRAAPRAEEERALSPEWVASVSEPGTAEADRSGEADPLRGRVTRVKETERLIDRPSMLPG